MMTEESFSCCWRTRGWFKLGEWVLGPPAGSPEFFKNKHPGIRGNWSGGTLALFVHRWGFIPKIDAHGALPAPQNLVSWLRPILSKGDPSVANAKEGVGRT